MTSSRFYLFSDIDLTDPAVEAAATKIQSLDLAQLCFGFKLSSAWAALGSICCTVLGMGTAGMIFETLLSGGLKSTLLTFDCQPKI